MSDFDEAAWIRENPRPEGHWQEKPVKQWLRKKQHAKVCSQRDGYDSLGRRIVSEEKKAWIKANPKPFANLRVKDMTPEQFKIHAAYMAAMRYALRTEEQKEAERKRQRDERKNWSPEKLAKKLAYQKKYRQVNKAELAERARQRMARPGKVTHRRQYERDRLENMAPKQRSAFEAMRRKNAKARRKRALDDGSITRVRAMEAFYASQRRSVVKQATPPFADLNKIQEIYFIAGEIKALTGEEWHVDHCIPLRGTKPGTKTRSASGLNVEGNLAVVRGTENLRKLTKFEAGDLPPAGGLRKARSLLRKVQKQAA